MTGALAAVAAIVIGGAAWLVDRRRRSYADLSTSPAAAVFAGRNEVKGRAWAADPLTSHCAEAATICWSYRLEEEREHTRTVTTTVNGETRTRTERYKQWHSIDDRSGQLPTFEVVDETGSVPVRLTGAKVVPRQLKRREFRREDGKGFFEGLFDNRTGRYRETESGVAVGDTLFVVGEARLDEATCVPELRDRVMVSTRSEESHLSRIGAGVIALVVLAFVASAAASALLLDPDDPGDPVTWLPGLGVATVVLLLALATIVHNRLRLVSTGVDRAWSLIDVQLQRRHDLIPALRDVVAGCAGHERDLLGTVAADRHPDGHTTSAELAEDAAVQSTQLRQVLAVAERYPQLRSDDAFLRLQAELADCETRIAASRTFYNDTLRLLRDRSRTFPGVVVARFVPLAHRDLISAEGWERTVPAVDRAFT